MDTHAEEASLTPESLPEWRSRLAARIEALGWIVPHVDGMGGYRLHQLTRIVTQAEFLSGTRTDIRADGVPVLGMFTNKTLAQLKAEAEAMPAESAFDWDKVRWDREARDQEATQRRRVHERKDTERQELDDIGMGYRR